MCEVKFKVIEEKYNKISKKGEILAITDDIEGFVQMFNQKGEINVYFKSTEDKR